MLGIKDKNGNRVEIGDTVKYENGRLYEITQQNNLYHGPGMKELSKDFEANYPIPLNAKLEIWKPE
jgi:signal peptidase I